MQSIAQKRKAVKSLNLQGINAAQISNMNEAELDKIIADNKSSEAVENETPAVNIPTTETFTTEKGEEVPVINAQYARMTGNGAFVFMAGEIKIVTNDSDLRFLKAKNGLNEGDTVAFKPESIVFNAQMDMYTGIPNKSASPKLMKVVNYRTENKHINLAMQAELTASGISLQDAKTAVQEKISTEVLATFKRPTFQL